MLLLDSWGWLLFAGGGFFSDVQLASGELERFFEFFFLFFPAMLIIGVCHEWSI